MKELAILDELGTRNRVTDIEYSVVKRFADLREQQNARAAIYISNLAPGEIGSNLYDGRIVSRLTCGTWFELKGNDRRRGGGK